MDWNSDKYTTSEFGQDECMDEFDSSEFNEFGPKQYTPDVYPWDDETYEQSEGGGRPDTRAIILSAFEEPLGHLGLLPTFGSPNYQYFGKLDDEGLSTISLCIGRADDGLFTAHFDIQDSRSIVDDFAYDDMDTLWERIEQTVKNTEERRRGASIFEFFERRLKELHFLHNGGEEQMENFIGHENGDEILHSLTISETDDGAFAAQFASSVTSGMSMELIGASKDDLWGQIRDHINEMDEQQRDVKIRDFFEDFLEDLEFEYVEYDDDDDFHTFLRTDEKDNTLYVNICMTDDRRYAAKIHSTDPKDDTTELERFTMQSLQVGISEAIHTMDQRRRARIIDFSAEYATETGMDELD